MKTDFTSQLWEETPDAILALSPDGKVVYWNRDAGGKPQYFLSIALKGPDGIDTVLRELQRHAVPVTEKPPRLEEIEVSR